MRARNRSPCFAMRSAMRRLSTRSIPCPMMVAIGCYGSLARGLALSEFV